MSSFFSILIQGLLPSCEGKSRCRLATVGQQAPQPPAAFGPQTDPCALPLTRAPIASCRTDKEELVRQLLAAKAASGKTFSQIAAEVGITNGYAAQLFFNQVRLGGGRGWGTRPCLVQGWLPACPPEGAGRPVFGSSSGGSSSRAAAMQYLAPAAAAAAVQGIPRQPGAAAVAAAVQQQLLASPTSLDLCCPGSLALKTWAAGQQASGALGE